jgi:hypothetical protein
MLWSIIEWGSIVTFLGLAESICGGYEKLHFCRPNRQKYTDLDYTRLDLIHSEATQIGTEV